MNELSEAIETGSVYDAESAALIAVPAAEPEPVEPEADAPAVARTGASMRAAAETPGNFPSFGAAVSNNRAWQWTSEVFQRECRSATNCTVIDRKTIRSTITPYNLRIRVEQQVTNNIGGSGISTPSVTGYLWCHPSTLIGQDSWRADVGYNPEYINSDQSLFTTNTRIIVGVKETATLLKAGQTKTAKMRTLTATCFAGSQARCEWWV